VRDGTEARVLMTKQDRDGRSYQPRSLKSGANTPSLAAISTGKVMEAPHMLDKFLSSESII